MSRKPQPDLQVGIVHVKSERRLDKILALVSRLATNRVGVSARFDDLHDTPHALHFACSVAFRPSKGPATDSKTPESTPCPPPGQTTRHNDHDHVAYFSTVATGLPLERRQFPGRPCSSGGSGAGSLMPGVASGTAGVVGATDSVAVAPVDMPELTSVPRLLRS